MIEAEKRRAIFLLHQEGIGFGRIAQQLGVDRKTVRAIVAQEGALPATVRRDKILVDPELLRRLYKECDGYAQRVHEKLVEEEGIAITYPTLTRRLRELEIGTPPKPRCDEVPDQPGQEMQHDTTSYLVPFALGWVRVIASLLYFRFSKVRYLKFYRTFNRFKMKCFFHEALMFWGHAASRCIIDNTNLARLRGIGKNAVMVPEMAAFAQQYGFEFICHEKNHANRKAGEEKGLHTVETNFLPGRKFQDLEDMNGQALQWSTVRMHTRSQGKTKVIPAEAFEYERVYLNKLPVHLPAPYLVHERGTDQYGYVPLHGNYFWVPGTKREDVKVFEYSDRMEIFLRRERLAVYTLPPDGVKNQKFSPEGFPQPRHHPNNRRKPTEQEEERLRGSHEAVGAYLDFALKPKGVERHRFVRQLFALSQQMSPGIFAKTLQRALHYRITSVETLRRIAILYMNMSQDDQPLPRVQVDEGFQEREAYQEGRLTEAPDLSRYDKMLEQEDDDG
jgi:transposase-like protein